MWRQLRLLSGVSVLVTLVSLAVAQQPASRQEPPQVGLALSKSLQAWLRLTGEQKTKLDDIKKEVDDRLAKLLTAEQRKTLQEMQGQFAGRGGPGAGAPRRPDVKTQLGATDEQGKDIEPKLKKVRAARRVLTTQAGSPDADPGRPPGAEGQPSNQPSGGGTSGSTRANSIAQA
jgi:hypothetical protein